MAEIKHFRETMKKIAESYTNRERKTGCNIISRKWPKIYPGTGIASMQHRNFCLIPKAKAVFLSINMLPEEARK